MKSWGAAMRLSDRMQSLGVGTGASAGFDEAAHTHMDTPVNPPAQAWIEERTRVAVSRNINVSGRLVFQEPVRIEGRFRGEISSSEMVVISEGGSLAGRVRSPRLLILGDLQGDVESAKSVVIGPRARFTGKIETEGLTVCEGAYLEGDVRVIRPG
jgi:cytoskeletal protein CcmA (bactofilin family)